MKSPQFGHVRENLIGLGLEQKLLEEEEKKEGKESKMTLPALLPAAHEAFKIVVSNIYSKTSPSLELPCVNH